MKGALLGPSYSRGDINEFLVQADAPARELTDVELPVAVAELLADEKVVGWFQGRMEWGPRALSDQYDDETNLRRQSLSLFDQLGLRPGC